MNQDSSQPFQPYPPQYSFDEDPTSLIDILLVLARHLKLIIITPIIFCIMMTINVLFFVSPIYVSSATFMSSDTGNKQSNMMGWASEFGFAMPNSGSDLKWSYEEVIKSRKMARTLLKYHFDTDKLGPNKELQQILTYGNGHPEVGNDKMIKSAINAVQDMIKINSTGNMFTLEVSTFEPQLATDVANAVMKELETHLREYNTRKTSETRQFIDERLENVKGELEEAEKYMMNFRENNRNIRSSPALQMKQERLARDVAVLIGVFTTLQQQLETAKIDEVKESEYVVVLDPAETPLYPVKLKKKFLVVFAGFLGIGFGMIFAFIREYVQNGDKKAKEKMGKAKSLIIKNITDFLPQRFRKI